MSEKVVGETAMLLDCAASVQRVDRGLRERVHRLAALLVPLARSESMLAAMCADPGLAADRAMAHAVLSRLGYPAPAVDQLLRESRALGTTFGPERLPLGRLEHEWLRRVWAGCTEVRPERGLLGRSMLGRQLDVLGATRFDVYSFTHAVMYASDLGARRVSLPRSTAAIAGDADAALALSLDIDDFDVTCEVVMTWPMLALDWSAAATFAFQLMTAAQDDLGFLPGPTFDPRHYRDSSPVERARHVLVTSYHTTYVMGILCAATLRKGRQPPRNIPAGGSPGSGTVLMRRLDRKADEPRWRRAFDALTPGQQDAVAPVLLTTLLRGAKDRGDLREVRTLLEVALGHGLADAPAARQAVDLLRRSALLNSLLQECRTPVNRLGDPGQLVHR